MTGMFPVIYEIVFLALCALFLMPFIFKLLWNASIPSMFQAASINYKQSFSFVLLLALFIFLPVALVS